jgi:hypothetical protein
MSKALVHMAVHRVMSLCDDYMSGYQMVSMRSALVALGYDNAAQNEIIRAVAEQGFTYCLDHTVSATHYVGEEMETGYPSSDVCYWGPDQLKSRLYSIDYGRDYGRIQ